jgi:hypothetical protein
MAKDGELGRGGILGAARFEDDWLPWDRAVGELGCPLLVVTGLFWPGALAAVPLKRALLWNKCQSMLEISPSRQACKAGPETADSHGQDKVPRTRQSLDNVVPCETSRVLRIRARGIILDRMLPIGHVTKS